MWLLPTAEAAGEYPEDTIQNAEEDETESSHYHSWDKPDVQDKA